MLELPKAKIATHASHFWRSLAAFVRPLVLFELDTAIWTLTSEPQYILPHHCFAERDALSSFITYPTIAGCT